MKADLIQTNFTSGEVSPLIRGRVDVVRYANGADYLENLVVKPQGPLIRRSGTQYITAAKNAYTASREVRLHKFVFSNVQSYMLEIGHQYLRIFKNGTPLSTWQVTGAMKVISNVVEDPGPGTNCYVTCVGHGLQTGDHVYISNVVGTIEANGTHIVGLVPDVDHFVIPVAFIHTFISMILFDGTAQKMTLEPLTVTTPYDVADIHGLSFTQSADVLYIAHNKYPTRKLMRYTETDWRFQLVEFQDGPYLDFDKSGISLFAFNLNDSLIVDANAGTFIAGDVNKYVEYFQDGEYHIGKITAVPSSSEATVVPYRPALIPNWSATFAASTVTTTTQVGSMQKVEVEKEWHGVGNPGTYRTTVDKFVYSDVTTTAGFLTSNYSDTFSRGDVGKMMRTGTDTWVLINSFVSGEKVGVTPVTMCAVNGKGAHVRINSRAAFINIYAYGPVFVSTDVGRHLRLYYYGKPIWGKIVTYYATNSILLQIFTDFPCNRNDATYLANYGLTDLWKLGAWSSALGYPGCVCMHEQRLVFAGTDTNPQGVWMSRSGDYENMEPSDFDGIVKEDSAINYTMASATVHKILWMRSHSVLLLGTNNGEWQCKSSSTTTSVLTPMDIAITPQSSYGSAINSVGQAVGSSMLYLQRSREKVRKMTYDYSSETWTSKDLSIVGEHMLRAHGGGLEIHFQHDPAGILWVVCADGTLVSMTHEEEQEVTAWSQHHLGNSGLVESAVLMPSADGTYDELYLCVVRQVNGGTVRYIEKVTPQFTPQSTVYDQRFLDCMGEKTDGVVIRTGAPGNYHYFIDGFSHLNGESVDVMIDGTFYTNVLVANGQIQIDTLTPAKTTYALHARAGYKYSSILKTLSPEGSSSIGTSQGKTKRSDRNTLRVFNSVSFKHGSDLAKLSPECMLNGGALFSGDYPFNLEQGYSLDGSFYIVQDRPVALNIISTMPQLWVHE